MLEAGDIILAVASSGVGALMGAAGANVGLRSRITALEHDVWGVKGNNGIKASVLLAHERMDRLLERERKDIRRIDRRNRAQHPPLEESSE